MGASWAQGGVGGIPTWNSKTTEDVVVVATATQPQLTIPVGVVAVHIQVTGNDDIWVSPTTDNPSGINLDSSAGGRDNLTIWIPTCRTADTPAIYLPNNSGGNVSVYITYFYED